MYPEYTLKTAIHYGFDPYNSLDAMHQQRNDDFIEFVLSPEEQEQLRC